MTDRTPPPDKTRQPLPAGYRSLDEQGINLTSDSAENKRRIANRPVTPEGARTTATAIAAATGHLGPQSTAMADARLSEARSYGRVAVLEKEIPRTASGGVDFDALCSALDQAGLEPVDDTPQVGDTYMLEGNTYAAPRR